MFVSMLCHVSFCLVVVFDKAKSANTNNPIACSPITQKMPPESATTVKTLLPPQLLPQTVTLQSNQPSSLHDLGLRSDQATFIHLKILKRKSCYQSEIVINEITLCHVKSCLNHFSLICQSCNRYVFISCWDCWASRHISILEVVVAWKGIRL